MLFAMLAVRVLTADTLGFFTSGYRHDGKNQQVHVYVFVDHYRQQMVLIFDKDYNWYIDEDEVTIVPVRMVEGGVQGEATYTALGITFEVKGITADLYLQGTRIRMRSTNLVPIK